MATQYTAEAAIIMAATMSQQHMSRQTIIEEFKSAIKLYLASRATESSEPMLLDERIIEKARILKSLATYIDADNKNSQFFQDTSALGLYKRTIAEMEDVNKHRDQLLRSFLIGQSSAARNNKSDAKPRPVMST